MGIRVNFGGVLLILLALLSERGEVIVIFMLSALFHEVGHLLGAKALGIKIAGAEIGFSGARIRLKRGLCSYWSELLVALAGPLFNLIAILSVILFFSFKGLSYEKVFESGIEFLEHAERKAVFEQGGIEKSGALGFFALSSAVQAAVNILPIKSFDGGRILHCTVAGLFGIGAAEGMLLVTTAVTAVSLWMAAIYLLIRANAGLTLFVFAIVIFLMCQNGVRSEELR